MCCDAKARNGCPSATLIALYLSTGSRSAGCVENRHTGDGDPLAPGWLPSLLALEIATARRPAEDTGRGSPAHSGDECCQPAVGSPADPWRTAQARHRYRTDHGRKIHGEGEAAAIAKTFLRNHADGIASMDLFVVPTVSFRLLYGFLILRHSRREILWLSVTAHPSTEWIARQLTELPRYLVRDRDRIYGDVFIRRLRAVGIRDRPIAPRSPWQNGYAERLIGSIRRDCLDHVVVFGERHLRHLLKSYERYYNEGRTHLSLYKDAPIPRVVQTVGRVLPLPILGGLHHQYVRV